VAGTWAAWAVHAYTASGALLALLAADAAAGGDFRTSFLWLLAAVVVDGTDGALARLVRVRDRLPHVPGDRLDDLVDYLTFVFVPALIVWRAELVPRGWPEVVVVTAMLLSSAYGFTRADAKTEDHFFTGFPSYWNVAVFYLFAAKWSPGAGAAILLALAALVFVPVGYVYPSRTPVLRRLTLVLAGLWGLAVLAIVLQLPEPSALLIRVSLLFPAYYFVLSMLLHARRDRRGKAR
jgi:phosphatidylcholine synthase